MKKYDIKTTDTETLKKWYHLMVLGRALDEKAPSYLLQSLGWSYHAPYAGHDGNPIGRRSSLYQRRGLSFSILSRYADRAFGRHECGGIDIEWHFESN